MKKYLRYLTYLLVTLCTFNNVSAAVPDLCLTGTGGLAGVPILDGEVSGDAGWNGAVQVNLSGDLGATTASNLFLGRANNAAKDSLFLGFVVDAPNPSPDTTIVLGFIPNDAAFSSDWRLHIKPFATGGAQATYWHNSGAHIDWNSAGGGTSANSGEWPLQNLFKSQMGNHWELELAIPIAAAPGGVSLGTGANPNSFKIYVNVMNTSLGNSPTPASTGQDVWPPLSVLPPGPITQHTPDPNTADKWAKVWLSGAPLNACTGVKLDWGSIGVLDPNPPNTAIVNQVRRIKDADIAETSIAACDLLADNANLAMNGPLNTFIAKPQNTMSSTAQVSVTFRIADWGIPGVDPNAATGGTPHWQQAKGLFKPLGAPVPTDKTDPLHPKVCDPTIAGNQQCSGVPPKGTSMGNPTIETPIVAGASGVYKSTWMLNYKQSCFYKFGATGSSQGTSHQCMQVDMSSTDPNTRFLNRSLQTNMDFVNASVAKRVAIVSGDQGQLPAGKTNHRFLLQINEDEQGAIDAGSSQERSAYSECNDKTPLQTVPVGERGLSNSNVSSKAMSTGVKENSRCEKIYRHFRDQQLEGIAKQHFDKNIDHMLSRIVRGFVYTGDKIIIDGNEYEYVRRVGDFGIVAGHAGAITGWTADFHTTPASDSSKMTEVVPGSNVYTLEVEPGHVATIEATITAEEDKIVDGTLEWWQWLLLILLILLFLLLFRRKP